MFFGMLLPPVTAVVDNRQGGDAAVCEDGQRGDQWRVWVDVGDVGIRPHSQFLQSLLHESWHGHLTHLRHTHTHTKSQPCYLSTRGQCCAYTVFTGTGY